MSDERIESKLDELVRELGELRERLASMDGKLDAAARADKAVDALRDKLSQHEKEDADVQSALRTQISNMQWWMRAAITAGLAGSGTGLAALLGGG